MDDQHVQHVETRDASSGGIYGTNAEYLARHAGLKELEGAEVIMWHETHGPSTPLDSGLLFVEVEKRAKRLGASEDDTRKYEILKSLRVKQTQMDKLVDENWAEWHTKELPSRNPVAKLDSSVDRRRFWAVVIGVNKYHLADAWALNGSCPDAVSIHIFLTKRLGVPDSNIKLLLSPTTDTDYPHLHYLPSTRANILAALYEHLRDNTNIRRGDNIIIYYSGHGARYDAHSLFGDTEDAVEALCPADRGTRTSDGTILDISDREISIFLEELRDEKGDHITVVSDCCHSGGAIRAGVLERVRAAEPLPVQLRELFDAADNDPRRKRNDKKALSADWEWDSSSCVLLAACLAHETAKETLINGTWSGNFTRALVTLLPTFIRDGKTYSEVCKAVTEYMPKYKERYAQNPLVVGSRQDCRLWYVPEAKDKDSGCFIA